MGTFLRRSSEFGAAGGVYSVFELLLSGTGRVA